MIKKMIKKISVLGIILNILVAVGIVCINFATMYDYMINGVADNLIHDVEYANNTILINTIYSEFGFLFTTLSISLLIVISSVILTVSYIRKNKDLYLVGIVLSVISFIYVCFAYFCNYYIISILLYLFILVLLIVGYVVDNKKQKNNNIK